MRPTIPPQAQWSNAIRSTVNNQHLSLRTAATVQGSQLRHWGRHQAIRFLPEGHANHTLGSHQLSTSPKLTTAINSPDAASFAMVNPSKPFSILNRFSPALLLGTYLFMTCNIGSLMGCKGKEKPAAQKSEPSAEKRRLSNIMDFCRDNKLDFTEVKNIAARIKTQSLSEQLDALTIVSFLLSLKSEGNNDFYLAKNARGKEENRYFIDAVLNAIEEGRLSIEDTRNRRLEGFEAHKEYLAYSYEDNSISVAKYLDVNSIDSRISIIHELYHFFQDIFAMELSLVELEASPFIKSAEYVVFAAGLAKGKSSPEAIDELIEKEFKRVAKRDPSIIAIHLVYARLGKDPKSSEWHKKLEDSLVYGYFLRQRFGNALPPAYEKARKDITVAHMEKRVEGLLKKAVLTKEKSLDELSTYLNQGRPGSLDPDLIAKKVERVLFDWTYLICLQKFDARIKSTPQSGQRRLNLQIVVSEDDPEMQEMLTALVALRPSAYIYRTYDGVQ